MSATVTLSRPLAATVLYRAVDDVQLIGVALLAVTDASALVVHQDGSMEWEPLADVAVHDAALSLLAVEGERMEGLR